MIRKVVKFNVKKDKLDEVKKSIFEFITQIKRNESETIFYSSYQDKDDETAFVHFMAFKNEKSEKIHRSSDYCKKFVDILYPNCTKEPVFTDL